MRSEKCEGALNKQNPRGKLELLLFSDPLWTCKITVCWGSQYVFFPSPGVGEGDYGPTATPQLENACPGFRNLKLELLRPGETVVDR